MIHEPRDGVTSEEVRAAMVAVCDEHGCDLPDDVIVSHGPQGAIGHEAGHGKIESGEPVIVDIWPRDRSSRCWADMTRTFVAGGVALITATALLTGWLWLSALLAVGFALRVAAGPRYSPLGQLATKVVAPRLGRPRLVAGQPKRFAQTVGLVFTVAATGFLVAGLPVVTVGLLAVLLVFALLESVVGFCAVDPGAENVVVTVSGPPGAAPGTDAGSVKVTDMWAYPAKGRATGGVRCHRFLRGEAVLTLGWAGAAPPLAASANGVPVDLPETNDKRDGSGVPAQGPIAAVG